MKKLLFGTLLLTAGLPVALLAADAVANRTGDSRLDSLLRVAASS